MKRNGSVITSYEVTVAEPDNLSIIVYSTNRFTDTSVHETFAIQLFTDYTVTVAASTEHHYHF